MSSLTVRRTFYDVGLTLREKEIECRRSRCQTDTMLLMDTMLHSVKETECVKECAVRWADEVSTEPPSSSDDGSSDVETVQFPSLPPGNFACAGWAHSQFADQGQRLGQVKKMNLWVDSSHVVVPAVHNKTTLVFKNVSSLSRRDDLCQLLNIHGFEKDYDFVYVPANFKTMASFGYAFVNFTSSPVAEEALNVFAGFEWQFESSSTILAVDWSDPHQGLSIHLERYRNCPVMHPSVADEFKPILLAAGVRVPFPTPTLSLSAPRDVRRLNSANAGGLGRRRAQ